MATKQEIPQLIAEAKAFIEANTVLAEAGLPGGIEENGYGDWFVNAEIEEEASYD